MLSLTRVLTLCLVMASTGLPGRAAVLWYTDRAAWEAASTNVRTLGFAGIAASGTTADFSTAAGLTLEGVQFVGQQDITQCNIMTCGPTVTSYHLLVADAGSAPGYDWGSGAVLVGPEGHGYYRGGTNIAASLNVGLPAGTTSVGFDLMVDVRAGAPSPAYDVTITLLGGETVTLVTASRPTRRFVGFTATSPLGSLTLKSRPFGGIDFTEPVLLDNFSVGLAHPQADPIPEPASVVLLGLGLTVLCSRSAWRRRPAAGSGGGRTGCGS